MLFRTFLLQLFLIGEISCQAIDRDEELFFISCLKSRHWTGSPTLIHTRVDREACDRFLNSADSAYSSNSDETELPQAITSRMSAFNYLAALVQWRNEAGGLGENILDNVSPCWKHSSSLESHWEMQFSKRKHSVTLMPNIVSKKWKNGFGEVSFKPVATDHESNGLVAAEIILLRKSPFEINEQFGRYLTRAYVVNSAETMETQVVHRDYQSSCYSHKGTFLVLNLALPLLKSWHDQGDWNLKMQVRVTPRRQYINTESQFQPIDVVNDIVGLALHFDPSKLKRTGPSLGAFVSNSSEEISIMKRNVRRRREARRPDERSRVRRHKQACRRISYKMPKSFYLSSNIVYPPYEDAIFNIYECFGKCYYPFSSRVNATNHAIAVREGMSLHTPDLNICCVPITYRPLYFTKVDENDVLSTSAHDDLIAHYCACR